MLIVTTTFAFVKIIENLSYNISCKDVKKSQNP